MKRLSANRERNCGSQDGEIKTPTFFDKNPPEGKKAELSEHQMR